jgi:membrane protease subunit HflK
MSDQDPKNRLAPAVPPGPVTPPPTAEDSGSQALSEALRSSFVIVKVIMVLLVIVFLGSGIYTVPSQKRAILLRFGKPVNTGDQQLIGPGLHWSFPRPIDEVIMIPIAEIQTVTSEAGWYQTTPEMEATKTEPPPGPSLNPAADGYTLTADGNIIHVRAIVRYRITSPIDYNLKFVNASNLVKNALDNALFRASAKFTADQILRGSDKLRFKEELVADVTQMISEQGLGISIEQFDARAIPPRQVSPAFEQVLIAEVERRKASDDATAYANGKLSSAKGDSNSIVNAGQTDRTRLIQSVAAEAQYFKDQLPYYSNNPSLFLARLQTEALNRVLTNAEYKFFVPARADGKKRELRLQLNREPQAAQAPAVVQ